MSELQKDEVKELVEPHFHTHLLHKNYKVETINANELLTSNRFDLAFKLYYLDNFNREPGISSEVYSDHIRAFTLGTFQEPGNTKKNSLRKYIDAFEETFISLKHNGFDDAVSLIPTSNSGSILNGAHRVACAISLDMPVSVVEIDEEEANYNYNFFFERGVPEQYLDIAATTFVNHAADIYIAVVWPTAVGRDQDLESIIPNIVYRKDIDLTHLGAHNFLSQVYSGEKWLGEPQDDYSGSKGKLVECFRTFKPVRVFAFQAGNIEQVLQIKESVRGLFNVGKHSIHITDTKIEAVRLAKLVFNDNSVHFLNHAKPNKYLDAHRKIESLKLFMMQNGIGFEDAIVDGGLVLSIYGIRDSKDIDVLFASETVDSIYSVDIDCHDSELLYHRASKQELLYNSKFYFYFNDIKFMSLVQLAKMKATRKEGKDTIDVELMNALIKGGVLKNNVIKLKQYIFYKKVKIRKNLIIALKNIGLYEQARRLFRLLRSTK